jgi:hypothetical protein
LASGTPPPMSNTMLRRVVPFGHFHEAGAGDLAD